MIFFSLLARIYELDWPASADLQSVLPLKAPIAINGQLSTGEESALERVAQSFCKQDIVVVMVWSGIAVSIAFRNRREPIFMLVEMVVGGYNYIMAPCQPAAQLGTSTKWQNRNSIVPNSAASQ